MSKFWVQFDENSWVSRTGMCLVLYETELPSSRCVMRLWVADQHLLDRNFSAIEEARAAALAFMQQFEEQES